MDKTNLYYNIYTYNFYHLRKKFLLIHKNDSIKRVIGNPLGLKINGI